MLDIETNSSTPTSFTTPYRRLPIPNHGFDLIEPERGDVKLIDLLDTASLYADLAHSGALIFRGFADTLEDFSQLVARHSARVTFDPARKTATASAAEISAGHYAMGLHRENGNLPFNPDLQWFFCLQPASMGSQTTLCDGTRVLFEMPRAVRRAFETRRIRYTRRLPWTNVRRLLSLELGVPEEEIDDTHLQHVNDHVEGQTYRRINDTLVASEFITRAIINSVFSGRLSFCNSLLGPSINYEPPRITWDNGDDIDFVIWDETREITEHFTYDIDWHAGDVVIIDNSRVMHGRRRLADPSRRIFGAQSYRREALS